MAYMGNLLRVNLTTSTCTTETIDEKVAREYVGGAGYGTYLLYTELKAGIDPLGPENKIVFATSPLSANNIPGGGSVMICFKSPATGGWGQARSGGEFGPTMRKAGFDFIVVEGKSEKPVYLEIFEKQATLKDASHLLDKNTEERNDWLEQSMPKEARKPSVMCIGPAGDNCVSIAAVMCKDRAAARGGGGAVMGSKNFVGIVAAGSVRSEPADKKELARALKDSLHTIIKDNAETRDGFNEFGTTADISATGEGGDLPTGNWRSNSWEHGPDLFDHFQANNLVRPLACYAGCPIACGRVCKVSEGPYKTPEHAGGEYETVAAFSAFPLSNDMDAAVHCGYLCNLLGLDTISAGALIAFAMECYENGIITAEDTDGLDLSWGNTEVMPMLLHKMAFREGLGEILSHGVKVAAEKLGKNAEEFAVHVKGLEGAAHDARASKALALTYATGSRGMCHIQPLDGVSYDKGKADFGMIKFGARDPNEVDRYEEVGKGRDVAIMQRGHLLCDIITTCKFMTYAGLTLDHWAQLLSATTGWDVTDEELYKVGERTINLQRMFNIREGFGRKDDQLPKRAMTLPQTGPYAENQDCVVNDFDTMLDEYYETNGWDKETGHPSAEKLAELGLSELVAAHSN